MRVARIFNANVKVWQLVVALVITSFAVAGLSTANGVGNTPPTTVPAPPLVDQVITACAHKNSGNLRVLWGVQGAGNKSRAAHKGGPRKGQCRKSERMLRWNAQGPPGPTGVTGPSGEPGPTGPTGPTV